MGFLSSWMGQPIIAQEIPSDAIPLKASRSQHTDICVFFLIIATQFHQKEFYNRIETNHKISVVTISIY